LNISPRYGLATVGYMAAVFLLSSRDVVAPRSIIALKLLHPPLFAGLAACLLLTLTQGQWWRPGSWQLYGLIGLITGGYAASDEWHQSFVPGRSASVGDFLLDGAGIALVLIVHWALTRPGAGHEAR